MTWTQKGPRSALSTSVCEKYSCISCSLRVKANAQQVALPRWSHWPSLLESSALTQQISGGSQLLLPVPLIFSSVSQMTVLYAEIHFKFLHVVLLKNPPVSLGRAHGIFYSLSPD